ncbi:type II toxin-antitoxin system Phd/YefM family antitoxin [Solicola gregarius]|uniref:Antitoxin n=1 Tax=Solicola gregarius TaxID=2908642 RepID=A0AA46YLS3_9ACTN|nr:type II toxin-antitoxin system Phd/YefM family antitoxin [Solicola gregarius]UYM05801.1 type II toxin-antitoxin system Phd/YefM family antitoxin [Solicola gregarius]
MTTYTLSEARANLSAILDSVERGEPVEITRHGRPAARLVAPLRSEARAERMWADVERIRVDLHAAVDHPLRPAMAYDADAHVHAIRAERDAR